MTLNEAIRTLIEYYGVDVNGSKQGLSMTPGEPTPDVWEAWRVLHKRVFPSPPKA